MIGTKKRINDAVESFKQQQKSQQVRVRDAVCWLTKSNIKP
jgi:hypothetical protein